MRRSRIHSDQSGYVSGKVSGRKISGDCRDFRRRGYSCRLIIGNSTDFPIFSSDLKIRSCRYRGIRVVGRDSVRLKERKFRYPEFLGIEPQFHIVRLSCGVVRSRRTVLASRKRRSRSVYVCERSGEGVFFIMDDVMPRRCSIQCRFRADSRLDRSYVRLYGRILGVLGISGKREEADGCQYCEHRYHHDEFNESESSDCHCPLPVSDSHFGDSDLVNLRKSLQKVNDRINIDFKIFHPAGNYRVSEIYFLNPFGTKCIMSRAV